MATTTPPPTKRPTGRWALPNPTQRSPRPARLEDACRSQEDFEGDQIPKERPNLFPLFGLGGDPKTILTKHSPDAISLLFWSINNHARLARQCEDEGKLAEAIAATNCVARNAKSILEMTVGKKAHISITGQDQIPNWEDLPQEKRQAFLAFAETVELPTAVQDAGNVFEGAFHDPSFQPKG